MANAAAFRGQLKVFVDRNLSPEAQSAALARAAKGKLADLVRAGRASPNFRRFVDGAEGVVEERVGPAPHGQIVYRFNALGAVVTFALSFLVNRSPARSGTYRRSFYLGIVTGGNTVGVAGAERFRSGSDGGMRDAKGRFTASGRDLAGGKFVKMQDFNPDALTPNVTEIVIGNTQPYSRKVDVQLEGNRKLSFSVPAGLFDDAVSAIKSRFGTLVDVKRVYTMTFPGQYRLKQEQYHQSGRRKGRGRGRAGKLVESPAIVITSRL
ncbi:hypothetical protein TSH7_01235 [Azospirillum sp. TSH7]|uniref:hypothetical protein n=1 Tax=unclassified Azospirillum TaxID=2630922 RepID=UPI000D605497|nr:MULTISPECIES: hypothetical protein [unclassified Azospirillum]PWC69097.1 hypothetical protein TSH7_01235 [Azospirillum sp. TSH7]PWC71411.1 hypothetical protein TSH20_03840 [Azospirillum sp. TSH20]